MYKTLKRESLEKVRLHAHHRHYFGWVLLAPRTSFTVWHDLVVHVVQVSDDPVYGPEYRLSAFQKVSDAEWVSEPTLSRRVCIGDEFVLTIVPHCVLVLLVADA